MRTLSARLLVLLTIALLPLGLIAVYQTFKVVQEAKEIAQKDILAMTVQSAQSEISLIRRAQGIAYALGTTAAEADTLEACDAVMTRFVTNDSQIIFAGFIELDGIIRCSSAEGVTDISERETYLDFIENPRRTVTFSRAGAATGAAVVIAMVPIYGADGGLVGAGSVSIPHGLADRFLDHDVDGLDMAIVNGRGEVLAATVDTEEFGALSSLGIVPRDMRIPLDGTTFERGTDDEPLTIVIVPLFEGESYLVGRWSNTDGAFSVSLLGTATPVFPVIMWLMSLFVAFFAIDRLVLRHLKAMRTRVSSFSTDNLAGSYVHLEGAPSEITDIASSYNQMVDRITRDHDELAESVREKDALLKEIHHRVKNNLQLIASILNMQLRQIQSPEARSVLRRVQDRVMSLATIHKLLYTDTNVDTVKIDDLMSEIIHSTLTARGTAAPRLQSDVSLEPVRLDPDQAVPLSLLVTEAITNAMKYAGATDDEPPRLSIRLTEPREGDVRLRVSNSRGRPNAEVKAGTGLGARLIEAFVQQLGGKLEIVDTAHEYVIDIRFTKLGHAGAHAVAA